MRDKVIALSAVTIAGIAVAAGLTIGALGGAFDDSNEKVQPPALRSDLSTAVSATSVSVITVPPSPTWQVAVPTTPRPETTEATSTTTEESTTSTTRTSRNRPTSSEAPATESESESEETTSEEATSTTR